MRAIVRDIMAHAPITTVLASATLPNWDRLPMWWRGRGAPTTHAVITQVGGAGGMEERSGGGITTTMPASTELL